MTEDTNFLDTQQAARYRVSGDGPVFHRFGNRIRYRRAALDAWADARERVSTADDGGDRPGTGDDGAPYRSVGDFGTVPAIELGLGYAAGPARFELLVEYRPRFAFKGGANFLAPGSREEVRANLSSVSGMLAGFVDLAGMGLPKPGPVRAVCRRRRRGRPYPDRKDDHDLPGDDDNRAGRKPDGAGLDGHGRGRHGGGRARDTRSGLALHGSGKGPHGPGPRPRGLARREP